MKNKALCSALFFLVSASFGLAQAPGEAHFSGVLNDFTPVSATISGSPYEMHGQWSVDLHAGGVADFYADMTMDDFGTTNGVLDGTKGGQNAHTHHIRLTNAGVTNTMSGCPTFSPATTTGIQLNGTVSVITGNGGPAPFDPATPPTSTLQVCVTGGTLVPYSNMTMVFGGPATNHFGTQAIHGAVRKADLNYPITLTYPVNGQGITGTVTVTASIPQTLDSAGSYLLVDGAQVGTQRVGAAPYSYVLNTATLSTGQHVLQVWAHDTNNDTLLSNAVTVTVTH